MGFFSFLKKIFAGENVDEEELDSARKRHGVVVTAKEKAVANKATTEAERFASEYNVWEEIDRFRTTFLIGGWAAKKFRPIGEEKVKRDLERLEKKRQEEERKKGKG
jgi:cell division septum initiation protein DivIVA